MISFVVDVGFSRIFWDRRGEKSAMGPAIFFLRCSPWILLQAVLSYWFRFFLPPSTFFIKLAMSLSLNEVFTMIGTMRMQHKQQQPQHQQQIGRKNNSCCKFQCRVFAFHLSGAVFLIEVPCLIVLVFPYRTRHIHISKHICLMCGAVS